MCTFGFHVRSLHMTSSSATIQKSYSAVLSWCHLTRPQSSLTNLSLVARRWRAGCDEEEKSEGERSERGSAFYATKTFENLETAANGTKISRKSLQKLRKLLNFRNANNSTENSENSGSKVEWEEDFRKEICENLGIPHDVSSRRKFWKMLSHSRFG